MRLPILVMFNSTIVAENRHFTHYSDCRPYRRYAEQYQRNRYIAKNYISWGAI